ncbi:MAG: hypothetical protein HEP70_00115 [Rhodobiaceae bacterium]|nr:hypothetical protein [Rhodobiaceae bacterium]
MSVYRYHLQFDGKVSPQDEMGEQMGIEAEATLTSGFDAAIGAEGVNAKFECLVMNDMDGSFTLQGEITLAGGTLAVSTYRPSSLEESPDPTIQRGTAECRIDSGTGSFTGASGTITLNFTVDEDARFTDLQTGLIFVG